MIYVYFGEFYWFNTAILGLLEKHLRNNPLQILTFKDYGIILSLYFKNNENLKIIDKENDLYMTYRRTHHGQPLTGNSENFNIIFSHGMVANDSKLLYTNSWLENSDFFKEWIKINNLNKYGDSIDTVYKNEPLPNKSQKIQWSLYEYLLKKFPHKPWEKYVNISSNRIYDLHEDLLKKQGHFPITKKLINNKATNDYIHIFPRDRKGHWNKGHQSHISLNYWIKICKYLKKNFPDKKICCHGHMESMMSDLKEYIDIFSKNIIDSIDLFYNAELLISPSSGMVDLALNCGLKNIIYIRETNNYGQWGCNPFGAKRRWVNIKNNWEEFDNYCKQILN